MNVLIKLVFCLNSEVGSSFQATDMMPSILMHLYICVAVSICTRDPGIDGRIILRWTFRKWVVGVWNGSSWLMIGASGGICDGGNEPSGSIICGEFLDQLKTC